MKLPDLLKHYDYALRDYDPRRGGTTLQHLRWMIDEMRDMSGAKVMRWLGFVQGALWTQGLYTIDEMREHNRGLDEPVETPQPHIRRLTHLTPVDFMAKRNICGTRAEARRLITQGAVKINGKVIDSITHRLSIDDVITIGVGIGLNPDTFTVTDDDAP